MVYEKGTTLVVENVLKLTPPSHYGIFAPQNVLFVISSEVDSTESLWYISIRTKGKRKYSSEVDSTESLWYKDFDYTTSIDSVLKLTPPSHYGIAGAASCQLSAQF